MDDRHAVTAWGLTFRYPLWNAAGMFKNGHGYQVVARQGAGAFVAGTTTSRPRKGNTRNGVRWPSVVYGNSHSASNWMGLPNDGHAAVADRLSRLERIAGCPVGASVSAQPELDESTAVAELLEGMAMYDTAGVDYIELNESCPNVEGHADGPVLDDGLLRRLQMIRERFLAKRQRPLPVVVKFSVDTDHHQLPELITALLDLEFDGVILGNTSTRYDVHRERIDPSDRSLYDHFTSVYGGGLSGEVVKEDSLGLATKAARLVRDHAPRHEFHVIRCGGVDSGFDVEAAREAGVLLNQWYTGYFEAFSKYGHDVYVDIASGLE